MEKVTIKLEEYLDLLRAKNSLLKQKLHDGFMNIGGDSFENQLIMMSKLNEWKFEFEANRDLLEKHEPKFCADDIPF